MGEMFRQIMGVHQGTVDSYLEEVLTNTVEQAAQSRALTEARLKPQRSIRWWTLWRLPSRSQRSSCGSSCTPSTCRTFSARSCSAASPSRTKGSRKPPRARLTQPTRKWRETSRVRSDSDDARVRGCAAASGGLQAWNFVLGRVAAGH